MTTIGANIRRYRKERKLTQKELANFAEISNTYLSDLEVDRTEPSIKTLRKIAEVFHISYLKLLEGTD